MPADPRLALTEDQRQVFDIELARREQQQDAQTRRLSSSFKRCDQLSGSELGRRRHLRKHIKISLCVKWAPIPVRRPANDTSLNPLLAKAGLGYGPSWPDRAVTCSNRRMNS